MGLNSEPSGSKLGQLGARKTPIVPPGYPENVYTWNKLGLETTTVASSMWFRESGLQPLKQTLRPGALDSTEEVSGYWDMFAPFYAGDNEPNVLSNLEIDPSDLGVEVNLTEGVLGPAILKALNDSGITWFFETRKMIDYGEYEDTPDRKTVGVTSWETFFGMPFEQNFRVYRNAEGKETCLWDANVLVSTRPFEHIADRGGTLISESLEPLGVDSDVEPVWRIGEESIHRGALTFGEWSTKVFIPILATDLFYMAECNDPGGLMGYSREAAFGSTVPKSAWPKPVMIHKRHAPAKGGFEKDLNGFAAFESIAPNVVQMGWTFSEADHVQEILKVVADGLLRIISILEDGYLNHRRSDSTFDWDSTVLSANTFTSNFVPGEASLGYSRWLPSVRIGLLYRESEIRAVEGLNNNSFDDLVLLVSDGAGPWVSPGINSYVWKYAIAEKDWDVIDQLLDSSVRFEVKGESTNSLSNWGIAKYHQGLVDEAIAKFELALAREDKFSEAEASYWLAKIWAEKGDPSKAAVYRARCEAAGGYGDQPSGKLAEEPVKVATFCSQCGTKFETTEARFCAQCGTKR